MQRIASLSGATLILATLPVLPRAASAAGPFPWQRTEVRAACADQNLVRNPYFGDVHVHTTYSFDAVTGDVRTGPRDAYSFAQGNPIALPPYDAMGHPLRTAQLGRALDFTAVTDHSEFFGEEQICLVPGFPGYDSMECQTYRAPIPEMTSVSGPGIRLFGINYLFPAAPTRFAFCGAGAADCLSQASLVWQDIQAAAEEHYDRSDACGFTTFVAYEWTGNTNVQNLHRNVIFRNAVVPPLPISYVDQPTPQGLWAALKAQCLDGLASCDVLAIPHNSNLSNGAMFAAENADGSPLSPEDAAFRAGMEPLVEITQHKGESECKTGVLTNDELCSFEKWPSAQLGLPPTPDQVFAPLLFVRNALKEGLRQEQLIGVNPFRLGLIGSTDTHNATPGATREDDFQGHLGTRDATPALMLAPDDVQGVLGGANSNPGGLAVVWAEENSRDALFAAMRRRETYATSGTRPIVRFFGGTLEDLACGATDFAEQGYADGVPMGGELGPVRGAHSPRFAVLAVKDPGEPGVPGTPLQRIQIVKGWIDANGDPQEHVFEVAGNPNNGATVDTATCTPQGSGDDTLCARWEDPQFDPQQRAFYYARVVENPVCRWSTRLCNAQGVQCATGPPPTGLEACCDGSIPATIQERAWTSPIWYRPEGAASLTARVTYGGRPARDQLRGRLQLGTLPAGVDPNTQVLRLTFSDDAPFLDATFPPGSLQARGGGRFSYLDRGGRLGGIRRLVLIPKPTGTIVQFSTVKMDLSAAERSDHMVTTELSIGTYRANHTRLWRAKDTILEVKR